MLKVTWSTLSALFVWIVSGFDALGILCMGFEI